MRLLLLPLLFWLATSESLAGEARNSSNLPGKDSALALTTTWSLRPTFRDVLSDFREGDGVTHLVEWDDGAGATLYAIGDFAVVGDRPARHFARWDGKRWTPLADDPAWPGSGYPYQDLVVLESRLLAGGKFRVSEDTEFWGVAEWTGASWAPFNGAAATNTSGWIQSLSVEGSLLLVRGSLNELGPGFSGYLALWDGQSWSMISTPNDLTAAVLFQGQPYAGGTFATAEGDVYVARWNGGQWEPLPDGPSFVPEQLTVTGGRLIAANNFGSVGGTPDSRVAAWDGNKWTAMPNAPEGDQHAIRAYGQGYIATRYSFPGWGNNLDPWPNWAGFWNGSAWEPFAAGGVGHATLIYPYGEGVLFGGYNSHRLDDDAGTGPMRLVYWSPKTGSIRFNRGQMVFSAVAPYQNGAVMGGVLRAMGWKRFNCIAAWIDSSWMPLGEGIPDCGVHEGRVSELATRGEEVLARVIRHSNSPLPQPIWHWNGAAWVDTGVDTREMSRVRVASAQGDFWLVGDGQVWRLREGSWESVNQGAEGIAIAILEHQGEALLHTSTNVQRLEAETWVHQFNAPGGGTGTSVLSHDGALLALVDHGYAAAPGLSILSEGGWEERMLLPATVEKLASTGAELVALGRSTWIIVGDELVPLAECDAEYTQTANAVRVANELIVSGSYNAYHGSLCVMGDVIDTSTSVNATVFGPERLNLRVTATVSGLSAPTRGVIGVDAKPGGSCTIDVLKAVNPTTSAGSCEIEFSRDLDVNLVAVYYGGGRSEGDAWGPSESSPHTIEVGRSIFGDQFE